MTMYRLTFEIVGNNALHKYCNADPRFYKNTTQIVPNSEIPDEDWYEVSRETDNPWSQYFNLKSWASEDKEFVRNVRLYKMVSEPRWELVSSDDEALRQ